MKRVRQNFGPVLLYFAGHDRDGFFHQRFDLRFLLAQHVDRATGMKSTDDHIDAGSTELPSEIEGTWKLIGLDSHQPDDKLGGGAPTPTDYLFNRQFFCSLIKGDNFYIKIAEDAATFHVFGQAVQDIERVAREHAFPKPNHVTIVVVLGGFDQNDAEFFKRQLRRWLLEGLTLT